MKVLWFVNIIPAEYCKVLGVPTNYSGGWIQGLMDAIGKYATDVALSVAFIGQRSNRLAIGCVNYYSLPSPKDRRFAEAVQACLLDAKPDVIHLHGTEMIAQALPRFVFDFCPVVLSIQGIVSECARNYLGGLSKSELIPYRSVLRQIMRREAPWTTARRWLDNNAEVEKFVCQHSSVIMGRTEFDRKWVNRTAPNATYVHVEEVMRSEFYKGPRETAAIRPHRIYAGAAFSYPLKGGHTLISSLALIKRKFPDIQVVVAASNNLSENNFHSRLRRNEYSGYLLDLIDRYQIRENIKFMPSLSAQEVRNELCSAELFVLQSSMENSPNSLVEAQLVGVPSISTDVGGVSSIVKGTHATQLVPKANPEATARSIMEVLINTERWQEKALNDVEMLKRRHSPIKVAHIIREIYNNCRSL